MKSLWAKSKNTFQKLKKWKQYGLVTGVVFILVVALAYWFNAPGVRQCVAGFDIGKCFLFGQPLWNWLELLGVPLTLALLGYFLQQREQKRTEQDRKEEQDRREEEANEEVLQTYFDRISSLLVEQNLLAIAAKLYPLVSINKDDLNQKQLGYFNPIELTNSVTLAEKERFDTSLDVIRAYTLSILRRFKNDLYRKESVVRFLIEIEIISKARLDLSKADLSNVYFSLGFTDLGFVNLIEADLKRAFLVGAKLNGANLYLADLRGAFLGGTNLSGANLFSAQMEKADLRLADLSFTNCDFAFLDGADLREAILTFANLHTASLDGAKFSGAKYNQFTKFPDDFDPKANGLELVD